MLTFVHDNKAALISNLLNDSEKSGPHALSSDTAEIKRELPLKKVHCCKNDIVF